MLKKNNVEFLKGSISNRFFLVLIKNIVVCTVLSVFLYSLVKTQQQAYIGHLNFFLIVNIAYYVALFFGQIPIELLKSPDPDAKAPNFYLRLPFLVRMLFWIFLMVLSFFVYYVLVGFFKF